MRTDLLGALLGFFLLAPAALADEPETPRVHGFRELGAAFKNVKDELKSSTPQVYIIQVSARQIRDAARAQYGWFPADSAPKPGFKTNAKAEIWDNPEAFKEAQDALAANASAFFEAASGGDLAAIRKQADQLGETCAACHKKFRLDDKH